MDRGSSEEEDDDDSDDNVPLAHALCLALPKTVLTSKSATPASTTASTTAAASKSTPVASKRPLEAVDSTSGAPAKQ